MKSPDEIKKGLECCAASYADCHKECPYKPDCDGSQILKDALVLIQQLQEEVSKYEEGYDALTKIIKRLEAERDAAVADLKDCVTEAAQGDDFDCCFACKYNNEYGGCDRPNYTIEACGVEDFDNKWTWRGVTKEE